MTDVSVTGKSIDASIFGDVDIGPLNNQTMGELLKASQRGTVESLIKNGHPVRLIRTKEVNETTLGALMMHFMLETIIAADLMGVNAFDQPAVESSKILTRDNLSGTRNR